MVISTPSVGYLHQNGHVETAKFLYMLELQGDTCPSAPQVVTPMYGLNGLNGLYDASSGTLNSVLKTLHGIRPTHDVI